MSFEQWLALATLLGAVGMWLMLPRAGAPGRRLGAVAGLGALMILGALGIAGRHMPALGSWASEVVFYVLAAVTVISAAAAVTFRNPVYCAIWFAMSLLGTAGLFLFQGSQFLGVATIVVYAGAILVTFLFVLMLAQPSGDAFYDRISWEGMLSAGTGALLTGMLTLVVVGVFRTADTGPAAVAPPQAAALEKEILAPEHMAHLGSQLFSRYLIDVEVAGTLLLVALVGAVAIVAQSGKPLPAPGDLGPRLDPRSVAPRGTPEDEARRLAAVGAGRQEVLRG